MRNINKFHLIFALSTGLVSMLSLPAQNWVEVTDLIPLDPTGSDNFGQSVSVSGDYAMIGASLQSLDSEGNNPMPEAGAVYVFQREVSGSWVEAQKIVPDDRSPKDYFGYSVFMNGDYAIMGAYGADKDNSGNDSLYLAGAAYIFKKDASGTWSQVKRLIANERNKDDRFGYSVCISGDYAIVGAHQEDHNATGGDSLFNSGSAYIFYKDQGGPDAWELQKKITAGDRKSPANFGFSVGISGEYVTVGAKSETTDAGGSNPLSAAGAAYIYYKDKNEDNAWGQVKKIVPINRASDDRFGYAVSISGKYAIVGAYMEDHDADGSNFLNNAGSAYVFQKDKNGLDQWGQMQKLVAGDREESDAFGYKVNLSGDYAIIGAPWKKDSYGENDGSAYIFINNAGNWVEEQIFTPSEKRVFIDDLYGISVSINDGKAVIGAVGGDRSFFMWKSLQANNITIDNIKTTDASLSWESGTGTSRAVFIRQGTTGSAQPENNTTYTADKTHGYGDKIGSSDWYCIYNGPGNSAVVNGLSENEQYRVMVCEYVGTPGSEVYEDTTLSGNPVNYITAYHTWDEASGFANTAADFGRSVSVSGNYAIVGTDYHEAAYIYEKDENGLWNIAQQISASDSTTSNRFGFSVAISGNHAIVGAKNNSTDEDGNNPLTASGAAYLFKRDELTGKWNQEQKIVASDRDVVEQGGFGYSVSISGDRAIIGAQEYASGSLLGSAYIFHFDGNDWTEINKIVPENQEWEDDDQEFGYTVSISGDYAVVGAPRDDYDTLQSNNVWLAGAAYIYKWNGSNWVHDQKIFASDRESMDYFGISVSVSGDYVIVGAYNEDHNQNGAAYLPNAGSAYIFKHNGVSGNWDETQKIVNEDREAGDKFGIAVSIAGDHALIGAHGEAHDQNGNNSISGAGSVYLFTMKTEPVESWEQFAKIIPGDRSQIGTAAYFGKSVSLSGDKFVIGAPGAKKAYLFSNQIQASDLSISSKSREMTVGWVPGNGIKRVVFVKEGGGGGYPFPLNEITYSADTVFGNGDQSGSDGWYCVYNESGNSVTVAGLEPSTNYTVMVFEYNGEQGSEEYYTGTASNNEAYITTGMDLTVIDIDIASEIITGTKTNIQYSMNSTNGIDGDWTYCTNGNTAVSFIPGEVYVRQSNLISNYHLVSTIDPYGSAPSYSIDFHNEETEQTIPGTVEYNFDNNFSTSPNTDGAGVVLAIVPGQDVYFRTKATRYTLPSLIEVLVVPVRPVVQNLSINFIAETTNEPIPETIEYNDDNNFNTENNKGHGIVISLPPGIDQYFRILASDTNFISMVKTLVVPSRPAATTYSVNYLNETTAENVSALDQYSLNPDMSESLSGAYQPVQLTPGSDLYIRTQSTVSYFSGEIQQLMVPEWPPIPVVSLSDKNSVMARFKNSSDGSGADVSVFDGLEYTTDGGTIWSTILDITMVDASGIKDIRVRKKATATAFKSLITGNLDAEVPIVTLIDATGCNGPDDYVNIQSNIDTGTVYLVLDSEPQSNIAELEAAIVASKGSKQLFHGANINIPVPTSDLFPGNYPAYLTDINDSISEKSSTSVSIYDVPNLNLGDNITKCSDTEVLLDAGSGLSGYSWSHDNSTSQLVNVTAEGVYAVTVTDANNCENSDSLEVKFNIPYPDEEICIVTVDMTSGKNMVVWEKTQDVGTVGYHVYREKTIGKYELIAQVMNPDLSIFKDTMVDPKNQSYLYKITSVDTCGNESELDAVPYHKPIKLNYVGSDNGINLAWTDYEIEGVSDLGDYLTSFEIYRGSDSTSLSLYKEVGSINNYTDTDPNALRNHYYYRVAGVLKDPCNPSGDRKAGTGPYRHSLSNMDDNKLKESDSTTSIGNLPGGNGLLIYPNPFTDYTTVSFPNDQRDEFRMILFDITGKAVLIKEGIKMDEIRIHRNQLKSGYYNLVLIGPGLYRGRLVIK